MNEGVLFRAFKAGFALAQDLESMGCDGGSIEQGFKEYCQRHQDIEVFDLWLLEAGVGHEQRILLIKKLFGTN